MKISTNESDSSLVLHAASDLRHFYALLATTRHGTSYNNTALDCDEHT